MDDTIYDGHVYPTKGADAEITDIKMQLSAARLMIEQIIDRLERVENEVRNLRDDWK